MKKLFSVLGKLARGHRKKTLFMHIGMGKTGTTALQVFFSENRHVLEKNGVCYPEYGAVADAHHTLSPNIPGFVADIWDFKPVQDWAPRIALGRADRVLVSSELIAWTNPELVGEFCESVMEWFDLKIVVYVRRQDNIIMASYNQHIKTGHQKRPIIDIYRNMMPRYDYTKVIEPWENAVGKDNIIVRPYESRQFFANDLRQDFIHHVLGINAPDTFVFSNTNPNPRLSNQVGEYVRLLNNIVEDAEKKQYFTQLLLDPSLDVPGKQLNHAALPPAARLEIIDAHRPGNEYIARRYLKRDDGQLFFDPLPDKDEGWKSSELSHLDMVEISKSLWRKDEDAMRALELESRARVTADEKIRREAAEKLCLALDEVMSCCSQD